MFSMYLFPIFTDFCHHDVSQNILETFFKLDTLTLTPREFLLTETRTTIL